MLSRAAVFEGSEKSSRYGDEYVQLKKEMQGLTPVPVAMNPDEVALVVFALCTPMASFMQGATVDVNGGALLNAQRKPFSYTVEGCIPGPQA